MKNKVAMSALLVLCGVGLLGANSVFAGGFGMMGRGGFVAPTTDEMAVRQEAMFQNQATMLGINVDEVKNAWAEGKSMQQLMKDKGITEAQVAQRKKDAELAQYKTQLQTLVSKGIVTQAQADKRLATLQAQAQPKMKNNMMRSGHRGWFGF